MEWKKFTINTRAEAEEVITGILGECGIYSVEIEDSLPLTKSDRERMFVDIEPVRENDGSAKVSFYLESDADWKAVLKEVDESLSRYREGAGEPFYIDPGSCVIETSDTEDADWINNWKKYFSHFYVDDILFIPSWESEGKSEAELKAEALQRDGREPDFIIHIDPGLAFGTGKHETTKLCIHELGETVEVGHRVLDLGTGSGVLSMIAFKLGAGEVTATDLDEAALSACEDNFRVNGLGEAPFRLIIGNIIDDSKVQDEVGYGCYDVAVANILADILIPMMEAAVATLKKGGILITSGIIEGREKDVQEAMARAGLSGIKTAELGEWRMVSGRKF